jgi:plastocyanin
LRELRAAPVRFLRPSSLGFAVAVICVGGGAADSGAPDAKATTHTVVIEAVAFQPETLTIARGDAIVWVNKDPFPHTVTSNGNFDSGELAAGKSWRYVARTAGEFSYVCTLHPNMRGTLTVKRSAKARSRRRLP